MNTRLTMIEMTDAQIERAGRNKSLGDFAKFALPTWETLRVYGSEVSA